MATKYEAKKLRPHFIREWLIELEISQSELADLMDTDKANVTRWIKEPQRVTMDVLSGVADALTPYSEDMRDVGNLLRHPRDAQVIRSFADAARNLVGTLPDRQKPRK